MLLNAAELEGEVLDGSELGTADEGAVEEGELLGTDDEGAVDEGELLDGALVGTFGEVPKYKVVDPPARTNDPSAELAREL
jgi:hypothetical protein